MNFEKFNWSTYFLQLFYCCYLLITPIFLCYLFDVNNPNNTAYNIDIISKHFFKTIAVIVFFSYFINLPFLFIGRLFRKILYSTFFVLLYLASIIDLLHVLLFNSRANSSSYYSIFSSNHSETTEFILDYSSFNTFLGLLLFILIPVLIYILHKKVSITIIKKGIFSFFVLLFIATTFITLSKARINSYKEISSYKLVSNYLDYKKEIQLLTNYKNETTSLNVKKSIVKENETHIIIIGESTSKYHMQLYGYGRKTNPELTKLQHELTVFNHVKSSSVHTIESIKDMFILTDENNKFTSHTLIDCFNEAGYNTYWLSNQTYLGENETFVSSIAKRANKQVFINPLENKKLDGDLIPELENILKQPTKKKVIFIHLMGTHLNYQNRYPTKYNVFSAENISVFGAHADSYINQYDNAVLYNDFVISEIIKKVAPTRGLSSVIYLSDHGDEVYDFRDFHGHSGGLLSKYMNSVPFFIWTNQSFKKLNQSKLVNSNKNGHFSLKSLAHTMQDLFDVKSKHYQSSKSFLNENLEEISEGKNRNSFFLPAVIDSLNFKSKIWIHRVNSIERLEQIQDKFAGMELDILFENGKFDVRHPPATSINLSLETFFSKVKDISKHYFWLDFKNLTINNQQAAINRLNYLVEKFGIKNHIIVETNTGSSIPVLNQSNYFSSYYLPNLSGLNKDELKVKLDDVYQNIKRNKPNSISQSITNYYIMNEYYRQQNKLIWALNLDWNNPETHKRIELLLNKDSTIKVCLVNYKTKGWR